MHVLEIRWSMCIRNGGEDAHNEYSDVGWHSPQDEEDADQYLQVERDAVDDSQTQCARSRHDRAVVD